MDTNWPAQEVRRRIAEGDMESAAAEALRTVGGEGGVYEESWPSVLDALLGLERADRRLVADALAKCYHSSQAPEPETRRNALTLIGAISSDFSDFSDSSGSPDSPGVPLADERRRELDELGRQYHCEWCGTRPEILAAAEIAGGGVLSPATVAFFRRSALGGFHRHPAPEGMTGPVLNVGEAWAEHAMRQSAGPDDPWHALLAHLTTVTGSKPSATWDKRARALVDTVGADRVTETALSLLALVGSPRTFPLERPPHEPDVNSAYDAYNANALRGLAWLVSLLPARPDTAQALGRLVETSLRKVEGIGVRNPKVANAGVVALSRVDSEAALAELARLSTRVTYKVTAKLLDTALDARATALGLTREETEELAVPAYGLTGVGSVRHTFGDTTALLDIHGSRAVLSWRNAAGKIAKSVPAEVKRDHADDLKELKAAAKAVDKTLSAQAERLDRMFLARRTWAYDVWRRRYIDHPLVGTLARRLLWTVDGTPVGFADGELRTLDDDAVTTGSEVGLWHPVGRDTTEVLAWRDWLERHGITQPFKQAHREVYLLTDAERTTGTYSNRFAAHVLRQHQFNSLAAVRGWHNKLRLAGMDDEAPPATRDLPRWGLRAEFWVEGDPQEHGGSYLLVRTDQVRFYPIDAPRNSAHFGGGGYRMALRRGQDPVELLPLDGIPPLVLSEVLRDVDLFVGVASAGNDPAWQDGGPGGRFQQYWSDYSFGELNQTARTRRALLERLIPRLAMADRCTLEDRFLLVKGERHTYKIHLGSGNVLMGPDDRYLCIVPKAGAAVRTGYLPYEGDHTLAVILSKAMLLAQDTKITDPTILSQL